ncbi:MAG: hypothetical protein N4A40_16750 [Tissierellales bacterium]|jgi:transcriptional regulator with XRE-family HTH domain|nr:hypothetical protein [Tissierellales bacterium]
MQNLAQKLGVSLKTQLTPWVFGKKPIPAKYLKKLSEELKVDPAFLEQKFKISIEKQSSDYKVNKIYENLDIVLKSIRK